MSTLKSSVPKTTALNKAVLRRYLDLNQPENKIMATYIWIDGTGEQLRGRRFIKVNIT